VTPITVAVLTVSDRCARGLAQDASGPAVAKLAQQALGAQLVATACVPDDIPAISAQLRAWALESPQPDLIVTTGGTGLSPRDVTPEATLAVLQRGHSGLLELARLRCYAKTPRAYLSRGEAGTLGRSLVINLAGSARGATEQLEALLDVLPHAIAMLRGQTTDHAEGAGTVSS
jgi:molybdopterin adenylyltransferase